MSIPRSLIDQLNGNPLYIRRVAGAMSGVSAAREEEFWSAYVGEITGGALYCYFAGTLKALFPTVSERRSALEVLHRIYSAGNEPSTGRAVRALVDQKLAPGSLQALMRTGLVLGAFGEYRAPGDPVLRDFVSLLYEREIAGRAPDEIRRIAHAGRRPVPEATWDLSVPLAPRSELVIAESIEQIGKNLHFSEDAIGQLQLAVIEACINAIEHSKGGGGRLSVSIRSLPDRLEVSVESPGPEFVLAETGEPVVGTFDAKGSQRGQGVKLMKRFADAVRFERTARGNRVVLVKNVVRTATIKEGASHRE
jgi:anti-sigma regulatory factor (Ser/Thr protein kinase)